MGFVGSTDNGAPARAGAREDGWLPAHVRFAIVGAGFAGLGMAARLVERGERDFVLLERAEALGGTWRDNTYPGCQCDVPSHLYSFSFALNPNWSRAYALQGEIWEYLERVASERGLEPHIRFGCEVLGADWDAERGLWELSTGRGELTAELLVAAVGGLSEPSTPHLPGLESFPGTAFHSARWNHDHDLAGERVAVVGTGASAIQFVPRVQPEVGRLHVFQRTAPWVLPHRDREIGPRERRLYAALPAAQKLLRGLVYGTHEIGVLGFAKEPRLMSLLEARGRRHLESQVPDPELRAKLRPGFRIGCKRILPSNDYYPALMRPNVELVASGASEVRGSTVVAADGTEREVDTIIFGTGFQVTQPPIADRVRGRGGLSLAGRWSEGMAAYVGTTIDGFPNMFMLGGPNTGIGHTSLVYMIESQIAHVLEALEARRRAGAATIEVRPEALAAFNDDVQRRSEGTVWTSGGCRSWYLDPRNGRNTTVWPDFTFRFRRRARRFDPAAYRLGSREPAPAPVGGGRA